MVFNDDELCFLLSDVEMYIENGYPTVNPTRKEYAKSLYDSVWNKLLSYSALTNFTKQDYSALYMANLYALDVFRLASEPIPPEILALAEKLESLI